MPEFLSKEINEKYNRLKELESEGLNIPRFIYLPKNDLDKLTKVLSWAEDISKNNKNQIFNIRTYSYYENSLKESSDNPHITDIEFKDLEEELRILYGNYISLIDAEIPDNGFISGNLLYEDRDHFSFEFVIKSKRAMVRDINKESFFIITKDSRLISKEESIVNFLNSRKFNNFIFSLSDKFKQEKDLKSSKSILELINLNYREIFLTILNQVDKIKRKNKIFEFTYFRIPSGIFYNQNPLSARSNIVFWEYRSF